MIVMCEAPDAISQLFDASAMKALADLEDMVELITVSDLNAVPVHGFSEIPAKLLTVTFRCVFVHVYVYMFLYDMKFIYFS